MATVAVDTVRAGSEDPVDFFLTDDDGPIDLSGVQDVDLRLQRVSDGAVVSFKTTDSSPLLSVIDADGGHLRLTPTPTTWQNTDDAYKGFFAITDNVGNVIHVPQDIEIVLHVRPSF